MAEVALPLAADAADQASFTLGVLAVAMAARQVVAEAEALAAAAQVAVGNTPINV